MNEPNLALERPEPRLATAAGLGPADSFGGLLQRYQPAAGGYDEAAVAQGQLRPAWQPLFKALGELSVGEVSRRLAGAQRQLELDGVAFNPHDSDGGVSRPWSIDSIPLVIPQTDWEKIAAGLEQRARVADLILLDLLGPQTLLHERVLPPEVLFANPQYSPAYHCLVPRPRKHLQFYAADLARSPEGKWWVTADRCRNPFGLGYILENRLITSRMLPKAFGVCNVTRLAPFFITLQNTVHEFADRYRDNPRIAIWTKGPQSRSYFEDAFLARYLGFTLVEGEDLAVRGNRVMLKTLGGLLPVEVLLRRIEDHHCDPAELTSNATYGVSGLMEVIRSGNVTVCNSIGSSLIESPMLQAFLPVVCKHLLGEELSLPSVATWWCGQPKALKYVLGHLDELIIRRAYRGDDEPPYYPQSMSEEEKAELAAQIRAKPEMFVGQEQVRRSTAPVWQQQQLTPWSLALRAFLVAKDEGYVTLPGGLARVSSDPEVLSHNMTSGEKSQDVWITSDEPVPRVTLLTVSGKQVKLKRGGAELPSRVADNLFWLGRNLERAEQMARLVRFTLQQLTSQETSTVGVASLVEACQKAKLLKAEAVSKDLGQTARQLTLGAMDAQSPQSIRSAVEATYGTAAKVRDRIALDAFRVITELRELFKTPVTDRENAPIELISKLDDAITFLSAISGLAGESVTRTLGWRFLDLGRRIERAWQTARVIRHLHQLQRAEADLARVLENGLQICDSFMTYRSRYFADVQPAAVFDLLITDDSNPRSIVFQLGAVCEHVDQLPRSATQAAMAPEQRMALSLYNAVRLADVSQLAREDSRGELTALDKLLKRLVEQLPRLSDTVSGKFLIHAGLQRHFASLNSRLTTRQPSDREGP